MEYKDIASGIADIIINKATGKNGLVCQSINCFNGNIVSYKSNVGDLGDYVQNIIWLGMLLKDNRYIDWGKDQLFLAEKYCKLRSGLYNPDISVNSYKPRKSSLNILFTNNTDILIGMVAAADLTRDKRIIAMARDYVEAISKNCIVNNNLVMMVVPGIGYKLGITEPMTSGNFIEELLNLYRIAEDKSYLEQAERIARPWIDFDYFKQYKLFARRPLDSSSKIINKLHDTTRMIMIDMNISKKLLSYSRPMIAKQNTHLVFSLLKLYKLTGKEDYKDAVMSWFDNIMNSMVAADNKFYSYYNIRTMRPKTVSLIENHSMIELLIDMYTVFKEQRFIDIAIRCIDSWLRESIEGLLPRNPGMNIAELDPQVDFCVNLIKLGKLIDDNIYINQAEKIIEAIERYHKTEYGYCYHVDMINKRKLSQEINVKNLALTLKPLLLMRDKEKIFKDESLMNLLRDR